MRSRFNTAFNAVLMCALPLAMSFAAERSYAQTRKPTAREIAAIRDCATRNRDNLDQGERQCLFSLVADPCINKPSGDANNPTEADCYRMEDSIWDGLLNENYKGLLDTLDDGQDGQSACHAARVDGIPGHHVSVLRRQNPGFDGDRDARRLRHARVRATGDAAQVLHRIVSGNQATPIRTGCDGRRQPGSP